MKGCVVVLLALAYVASPIDLIPELLFGPFGMADDVVVGLVGLRALLKGK